MTSSTIQEPSSEIRDILNEIKNEIADGKNNIVDKLTFLNNTPFKVGYLNYNYSEAELGLLSKQEAIKQLRSDLKNKAEQKLNSKKEIGTLNPPLFFGKSQFNEKKNRLEQIVKQIEIDIKSIESLIQEHQEVLSSNEQHLERITDKKNKVTNQYKFDEDFFLNEINHISKPIVEEAYISALRILFENDGDEVIESDSALPLLETSVELNLSIDDKAMSYLHIADIYAKNSLVADYPKSREAYKKAIALESKLKDRTAYNIFLKSVKEHVGLSGCIYAEQIRKNDSISKAMETYHGVVRFTNHPYAHFQLAIYYYVQDYKDKAREHIKKVAHNLDGFDDFPSYYKIRQDATDFMYSKNLYY
ncbi:MAG: hypothetical protein HQK65_07655 [Desulfamplus sp.]|nr:hypothetical protein [Desulfamplus sp.]